MLNTKLVRSFKRYKECKPEAVMGGSDAQSIYFVRDAKQDIEAMGAMLRYAADMISIGHGEMAEVKIRELLESGCNA